MTKLQIFPSDPKLAGDDLDYEDFLAVQIECAEAISESEAAVLTKLYEGWRARVEKASRKMAREDGDELLPIRFDDFSVSGAHARGGASRFLAVDEACAWLARELAKVPGVVKLVFGEEDDVPASPQPGGRTTTSPVSDRVKALTAEILGEESGSANVLGRISIRFTGEGLPAFGKQLRRIIDEAVLLAGDVGSIWVRGTWGPLRSLEEVNKGRDLREKAGRALLDRILDEVAELPKTSGEPVIANLVLSDGPRPERSSGSWQPGSRVAASFGVRLRVNPIDDAREPGGHLEIYVPLADLDSSERREAWRAFGEKTFASLRGSIGTLSPALWMEAIAPNNLPITLFTGLPAVAVPQIVGLNAAGYNFPDFAPDLHHGLFEPPWIAWLSSPLASLIATFPGRRRTFAGGEELRVEEAAPLEMDDARYARYRGAWAALDPLRIRWTSPDYDDDRYPWRQSLERFFAPQFGELDAFLTGRLSNAQKRCQLHNSSWWALRDGKGKEAFAAAEEAIALGGAEFYEVLLRAVLCFEGEGKPNLQLAPKAVADALAHAKAAPRIPLLAAKILLLLGDRDAALAALADASVGDQPDPLEADPAFLPVRGDDRFRRAFGWPPRAALDRLRADNAKPDLKPFRKFAKAVAAAPDQTVFARGATEAALAELERTLGVTLPEVYRSMLERFDGAMFHEGRECLYSTAELLERNRKPDSGQVIEVGRNLVLYPALAKKGEAPLAEKFRGTRANASWKKLDACLTELLQNT